MTRTYTLALAAILVAASSAGLAGQSKGLDPARILEPLKDNWLTYSGDYSGKRYSALTQLNLELSEPRWLPMVPILNSIC